jgi:hypothetical protein
LPDPPGADDIRWMEGDPFCQLRLGLPGDLSARAVPNARVELRHVFLDLPGFGGGRP